MSFSETFQFPVFLMSSLLTICLYTTYIVYPHLFVAFTGFITFKARYHKGDVCLLKKKKIPFSNRSSLDENEAFLTTADSAVKLLPDATKPVNGWKGLEYKASFPLPKPPGANFYPPDMDKMVMD